MPEIVNMGNSIEGLSIYGMSRDPLKNRGLQRIKNIKCYQFISSFDVNAEIKKVLNQETPKIESNSICILGAEIKCEKAVIHSLSERYSSKLISNASAKHSSNSWNFPKQTNVKILISHEEIKNAIEKRKLKEIQKN
jgi:hypothetical protein